MHTTTLVEMRMVTDVYNPSTQEAEKEALLQVQGKPGLHSDLVLSNNNGDNNNNSLTGLPPESAGGPSHFK